MSKKSTIDYGIDLGTTNSAIAKFNQGEVEVFSNPKDYGRSTLPSVVGFRKTSIFVGTKAKEFAAKDPQNVKTLFKRKMGTSELLSVPVLDKKITPVELSSHVIKELRTFVLSDEPIDSLVITIPSAFNTQQCAATKEAGIAAGVKNVVLLQEPIAASLAYANSTSGRELPTGLWIVYDLGGGTFDAAILSSKDGDLQVVDHEGDNYLGGADFDDLIVQKLFVPAIEKNGCFEDLKNSLTQASGKRNGNYQLLLMKAEQVKISLSTATSTEVDLFDIVDDEGCTIDFELTVTQSEFQELIRDTVDKTITLLQKMLTRNGYQSSDLEFTLMVGGSTFIPYIRNRVSEVLGIDVEQSIDPTTAVAIGAAYYAGSKIVENNDIDTKKENSSLTWKLAYDSSTREENSLLFIKVHDGFEDGLTCRITRQDGGFDSGWFQLEPKQDFDLPIATKSYNIFKLEVRDGGGNLVSVNEDQVQINSGASVKGQPLPNDICIEVDDEQGSGTRLHTLFKKNQILPLQTDFTRTLTKSIAAGELDTYKLRILEGPEDNPPSANLTSGYSEISGKELSRDVLKGSEIHFEFRMSEDRGIDVEVYIPMTDQTFKRNFKPAKPDVETKVLSRDSSKFLETLKAEFENDNGSFELRNIETRATDLDWEIQQLAEDDSRDEKYKLEAELRDIVSEFHAATKDSKVIAAKREYAEQKLRCQELLEDYGTEQEHKMFSELMKQEESVLNSQSSTWITDCTNQIAYLYYEILWRTPDFLEGYHQYLADNKRLFTDQTSASALLEASQAAINEEDWDKASILVGKLNDLLPSHEQNARKFIGF